MWTQASAPLLLLACCLWPAEAQSDTGRRQSIWDDPIRFKTKAGDLCTMIVTGHREFTRLRLSCQSNRRAYWCEYIGKPDTCRPYSRNPRHYFVQMSWGLRKLQNACQAPRQIKPHMCTKATDESQMVFSSASFARARTETARPVRPVRPEPRPVPTRPDPPRTAPTTSDRVSPGVRTTKPGTAKPTAPTVKSHAKKMAQQYCWRSLQGVCAYVIGWFRN
ncbi:fibroblast growth factor binding protein 2a [Centroberyx gerrardi]|uniref:fibroblast growth factor binding protein 2a n=1 Tax=Centroberyx gerrardi TaxID=166262 RepID=UPI003AAAFCE4